MVPLSTLCGIIVMPEFPRGVARSQAVPRANRPPAPDVATLPLDPSSTFIRSQSGGGGGRGGGFVNFLGAMAQETRNCR